MAREDDQFEDDRRDEPNDREGIIPFAKSKTSTVGIMLILVSMIMFLSSFANLYVVFGSGVDFNVQMLEWMKGMNQDPQFQKNMQDQIDQRKNLDPNIKAVEKMTSAFFGALGIIGNILVLLAGLKIRALQAYALCLTGSIFAIVMNGCCCIGIPIGIWALIVLMNSDVKAGFQAMRRRSSYAA